MKVYIGTSGEYSLPLKYRDLSMEIAENVASLGYDLVFKGNLDGLTGNIFRSFKFRNNNIEAVTDMKHIDDIKDLEIEDYEVLKTNMECISKIYEKSDVLIFIPGGIETLSEFTSVLEEEKNNSNGKRIILFDYESYFMPVMKFLSTAYHENFIHENDLKLVNVVDNVGSLNKLLKKIEKEMER